MQNKKTRKLPRGSAGTRLTIHFGSPCGMLTAVSTRNQQKTDDRAKALLFKLQFLEEQRQRQEPVSAEEPDLKKGPLSKVAALYFDWKTADGAIATIAREKRILKNVEKFFGTYTQVRTIKLHQIREYHGQVSVRHKGWPTTGYW